MQGIIKKSICSKSCFCYSTWRRQSHLTSDATCLFKVAEKFLIYIHRLFKMLKKFFSILTPCLNLYGAPAHTL